MDDTFIEAMKKIRLTNGKYAKVDDDDYPYLRRFIWVMTNQKLVVRETMDKRGMNINIAMADFIKQRRRGSWVIYNNGNSLDLRKENVLMDSVHLRAHRFKKKIGNYTSRYKGVALDRKNGKFRSTITYKGKQYQMGRFESEKEAALKYNEKALELYGELAYQNKI
jgi:hypothetical protein